MGLLNNIFDTCEQSLLKLGFPAFMRQIDLQQLAHSEMFINS